MTTSAAQRRMAYLAWTAVCVIWGTTYLGIRICLESMPPALMGGLRWTLAGVLLLGYLAARGEKLPPPSQWGRVTLLGFLLLGLGNGGVVVAEQWVASGLAAVMVGTSPFWMTSVEAVLPGGERLRPRTILGLAVGFSGIVVLVWPELTVGPSAASRNFLLGIVALQIASIGWSLGSSYSRRATRRDNILVTTACQMLAGGLIMTAVGTVRGEWHELFFTTRTMTSFLYLSTIGAIGGFVAYTYALRHLAVSFVSLYAYVNPVIAVALGVLVLGEQITPRMAGAGLLVFAGVAIVRWAAASSTARPAPAPVAEAARTRDRRIA